MPTFSFQCKECKYEFEELKLWDDEIIYCPKCNSAKIEKNMKFYVVPIHFRGKGFYTTENRSKKDKINYIK